MKKPNPENYNFLWLVNNQPYFPTSFWVTPEYLKRDFLITIRDRDLKAYVGKKELNRLSLYGLRFFEKDFQSYKERVNKGIKEARNVFKRFALKKIDTMTNSELREEFLKMIDYIIPLWTLYFYTEYFLHEGVQEKIEENAPEGKELLKKVKQMQKLKFNLRTILNKTYFFKGNILIRYLQEIQKRTKRKDLLSLHYKEISDLLIGKKIGKLDRRYIVFGKFNNWQPIAGKEALRIINRFDNALFKKGKKQIEFKGQIANRGVYRGRVKIVPFDLEKDITKDISKMKKGEVLVTGSTGPEMIKACQKAGAIVTEEGGICSHAAIVSRELNIPCVIGTKIATQVFKDGDRIEVDAKKGKVKKLYS